MTELGDAPEERIFSTRLVPYRSMKPKTANWIVVGVGCLSAAISVPFYYFGAWPVIGFLGLDVLVLLIAFKVSFRSAEAYETLVVTPLWLEVVQVTFHGARREWRFNPVWVRLERTEHKEFGTERVALSYRGETVEVGGFLGPEEKAALARDLAAALSKARRGPQFA